jgi:hypothetical protein
LNDTDGVSFGRFVVSLFCAAYGSVKGAVISLLSSWGSGLRGGFVEEGSACPRAMSTVLSVLLLGYIESGFAVGSAEAMLGSM